MRTILVASILAIGLLAFPAALAARGDHGAPSGVASNAQDARGNGTASHQPAWIQTLLAQMKDIRSGCRDTTVDHANMTGAQERSWAHCIRDGYHSLFESIHWRHHEAKAKRLDAKAAKGN